MNAEDLKQIKDTLEREVEALRLLEEKSQRMLDAVTDGIFVSDLNGIFTSVTIGLIKMLGYRSKDDFLNKSIFSVVHPSQHEKAKANFAKILEEGDIKWVEHDLLKADGSIITVEVSVNQFRDASYNITGMIGAIRDITGRKKAEEKIRQSAEEWQTTFDSVSDLISILDRDFKFIRVNKALADAFKLRPEDLIGKHLYKINEKPMTGCPTALSFKTKEPAKLEYFEPHIGIYLEVSASPLFNEKGEVVASVRIARDVTERKKAQQKLEEKTEELVKANTRLKEVDRLKSVFLASMSHELRTPLNSIIGFTSLILQGYVGEISDEQKRQLTLVKSSADHLLSLINDILDISKIEAGKVELSLEEFVLDDILKEVIETFSPIANLKHIEVLKDVPEGVTIFSDKRRLKQILMNLVNNAIKFTDRGNVKVTARIGNNDNLDFRVSDTGIGIRKEDMEKLFVPFQQVDTNLVKIHSGTGLGLHLSKKLVAMLGGEIFAKSKYGEGSEFGFFIPLRYPQGDKE